MARKTKAEKAQAWGEITSLTVEVIEGQLLRSATGRQMFCPDCDDLLDCRRSVFFDGNGLAGILCGKCFDSFINKFVVKHGWDATQKLITDKVVDVMDGRLYDWELQKWNRRIYKVPLGQSLPEEEVKEPTLEEREKAGQLILFQVEG